MFSSTPPSLSWRRFGFAETAGPLGGSNRTKGSSSNGFVTNGQNQADLLEIDSITLAEQRAEKVPRLAGRELLEMAGLAKRRKRNRKARKVSGGIRREKKGDKDAAEEEEEEEDGAGCIFSVSGGACRPLVVDIRTTEEYRVGAFPDSLHLPLSTAFSDVTGVDDASSPHPLSTSPAHQLTSESRDLLSLGRKGRDLICVAGSASKPEEAKEFAERLLRLDYSRVCVLHGGVEVFRSLAGVLCVPNT